MNAHLTSGSVAAFSSSFTAAARHLYVARWRLGSWCKGACRAAERFQYLPMLFEFFKVVNLCPKPPLVTVVCPVAMLGNHGDGMEKEIIATSSTLAPLGATFFPP